MNKYLIVNADDFGLTDGTNKAIIDCFNNGIVRSASIMPTGKAFDGAILLAKQHPQLSVGVHLTLVGEKPVLLSRKVPTLVNMEGNFHNSQKEFIYKYLIRKVSIKEVKDELEAQIAKVSEAGVKLTHLDSHQHLHILPGIIDIVIGLAVKYRIKNIRVPLEWSNASIKPKNFFLNVLSLQARKKILKAGLGCADHFWGLQKSGRINEAALFNFIANCRPGTTEMMCHPAYIDDVYREEYIPYYKETGFIHKPEDEVAALTSKKIIAMLKENGVGLIGF